MNVPQNIINVIKELYKRPTFKVEMEGVESEWTQQTTERMPALSVPFRRTHVMFISRHT